MAIVAGLKFIKNNNFSRKDILNIQSEISNKVLNSIILFLIGTLLDNINDSLFIMIISEIV